MKRRLICVRHAKSAWDTPDLNDRQRPLNARGKRDAPEMGRRLAGRGVVPDAILSSPAERACATALAMAAELGFSANNVVESANLYFCGPEAMLDAIRALDDHWRTVMLVAHNPDISDFISRLAGIDMEEVPTCAVADMAIAAKSWAAVDYGLAKLLEFDYPKNRR